MAKLVGELAALGDARLRRVIVTLNVPEAELARSLKSGAWPFALMVVQNPAPRGFGANHNQAFSVDTRCGACEVFTVVNPDIRLKGNPFDGLLRALAQGGERAGACYPVQIDEAGRRQDHERLLPTPLRLWRRRLSGGRQSEVTADDKADWVNAAFLLLRREAYASVGGFDEAYHMYCEDVDLCLRLRLAGWQLLRADDAVVVHGAERASHRLPRHLVWHVRSLLRLWRSRAWSAYRAGLAHDSTMFDSTHSR